MLQKTTWLLLALMLAACATHSGANTLRESVNTYNQNLRWKRFANAAHYVPADQRAEFLQRYLQAEDDLFIQSMEVRNVSSYAVEGEQRADVVLVAEAYLLPSTVVEKITIVQKWHQVDGAWILEESSRELVP